jgi:hypothetical protein
MRSLRALIVAECVERFRVTDGWEFWLAEDGRAAGKAVNQAATRVGRDFGVQFDFCGIVVITGVDDDAAGAGGFVPGPGRCDPPADHGEIVTSLAVFSAG